MILEEFLTDLNERLDVENESRYRAHWKEFLNNRCGDEVFEPPFRAPNPPSVEWPEIHINDAIDDIDLMILTELKQISDVISAGGNTALCVRSNYGCSILPSLFGCDLYTMPRRMDSLPTSIPLHELSKIKGLLDSGVPDLNSGQGAMVFDTGHRFRELFDRYENIASCVGLYHPDLQGPVDVAELVWGSELYFGFIDEPEIMHQLLDLICETYLEVLRRWFQIAPPTPECAPHWSVMHTGSVMLRNDTLNNLSPEIYDEFVRPYDQKVFDEFDGGAIHFCGRGDHYISSMAEMRGLTALNVAQPELNDMKTIYENSVDVGIKLLALESSVAGSSDRPLRGQVQCYHNGLCDN